MGTFRTKGFSLSEMLLVIMIIGIITLITVPFVSDFIASGKESVAKRNAQQTVLISSLLSGIGVAHVLPESLGGIEATSRLLRRGIFVPDGPMQGERFTIGPISDENIEASAIFMELMFGPLFLQLAYNQDPTNS